jgi:hypothetical protein
MEVLWTKILRQVELRWESMNYPPLWYALWVIISFCGIATWYLRNFTQRVQLTKLIALVGVVSMLSMVFWTFLEF